MNTQRTEANIGPVRSLAIAAHFNRKARHRHCIHAAAHLMPMPKGPVVYFIGSYTLSHVKIGFARNLARRILTLQTGNPCPLSPYAYVPGGIAEEAQLHKAFEDQRGNGEWFLIEPPLERVIKSIQAMIAAQHCLKLPLPSYGWGDDDEAA